MKSVHSPGEGLGVDDSAVEVVLMADETKWKCPRCQAPYEGCGSTDFERKGHGAFECQGLCCDGCENGAADHGESGDEPCLNAKCYHCGWTGRMPQAPFNMSAARGWEKTALKAGWTPPEGWAPGESS